MIIGYDHRGNDLAEQIRLHHANALFISSIDYPDIAYKVAEIMLSNTHEKSILICKTGVGMSIAANRYKHLRAALVTNIASTELARKHNNANVLCIGASTIQDNIIDLIRVFLNTEFDGGRHADRLNKI